MTFRLLLVAIAGVAQFGSMDAPVHGGRQRVAYVAEPQTVSAGKREMIELRFHVEEGFHVNSHRPKSELQIPTVLALGAAYNLKLAPVEYPAGKPYHLENDSGEVLDVYSDDFVVKVPVVAAKGSHELQGELKYQACDHAACYPPRTLPVHIVFEAK